ncbi:MAG: acetylxylan esterase [Paenibacillaceae bacterium]|nr:acetylxylan esterase [Paenibacillaceae bacterium]
MRADDGLLDDLEHYSLQYHDVKDQLKRVVYERSRACFRQGEAEKAKIDSLARLAERQAYVRERFAACIGGIPEYAGDLTQAVTDTIACDGFAIEKVIFESRPGVRVTCNLYLPAGASGPGPAVLFLCGHHDDAKHQPQYQIVCQTLVRSGLVVLAMDPPGQGERLQYADPLTGGSVVGIGVREHDYAGSQCLPLGDSLARYFVHDAMRAVDYLSGRPEVDPARIGVTGNSGGGTQTSMLMLADPRIAAAAPGTFLTSREAFMEAGQPQDAEQIWPGYTAFGLDHDDILLAMAPRPVLVLAARYDFFPIEGTRDSVRKARCCWELHGAADRLELFEEDETHRYSREMAKAAARFFARHLGVLPPEGSVGASADIEPLPPSRLWCTATGQLLTDPVWRQGAVRLHDEIAARSLALTAEAEAKEPEAQLDWLRRTVFGGRAACELNPRLYMLRGVVGQSIAYYNAMWRSQPGLFNHGFVMRDGRFEGERLPATVAVWDGGTSRLKRHWEWIEAACASGRAVLALDVTGSGALAPRPLGGGDIDDFYEIKHKLCTDLFWIGDSLAAMRVYDVLRAVRVLRHLPDITDEGIMLYANGRQGMYGLMAAALDDSIAGFSWEDGMDSVAEWVRSAEYEARDIMSIIMPGMLQHVDLPALRGVLRRQ